MGIRRADFAGSWYPGTASECRKMIEHFSDTAVPCPQEGQKAVGGIVPHAGWFYSGNMAFNVLKCLKETADPETIIIFGRHLHAGSSSYITIEGEWETPFGTLEIDKKVADNLVSEFPFTIETDTRYEQDNTIELQLPFIKYLFPDALILPIGLPPDPVAISIGARAAEIAEDLNRKICVLGSTDLTHYGNNYGYTPKGVGKDAVDWVKNENDKTMVDLMVQMNAEEVIKESRIKDNACCSGAAAAAISASKKMGAQKAEKLIYQTSYDIRPADSFVGYAGILFFGSL
ncbi:AmmeMemoRadiSam system protein B [Thermodesulfobacteriota bacterium]